MEDGEMAVGVLVHPDPRLDEVMADRARRDLQDQALVAHGVVVADGALLVDAQDVEVSPRGVGHEGRAKLFRGDREAGVVGRQIELGDEPVGRLDGGDPG